MMLLADITEACLGHDTLAADSKDTRGINTDSASAQEHEQRVSIATGRNLTTTMALLSVREETTCM